MPSTKSESLYSKVAVVPTEVPRLSGN